MWVQIKLEGTSNRLARRYLNANVSVMSRDPTQDVHPQAEHKQHRSPQSVREC